MNERVPFGYCNLSYKPTRGAVVTKEGYLYDKEMILKHILQEKELIREKKIAFAACKSVDKKKETLQIQQDVLRKKRSFENIEDGKPLKRTKGSFDSDKSNAKDHFRLLVTL